MSKNTKDLLILGSNVRIYNLPVKEVSLLEEGSLPAYGYNPGDFIELLAGRVSVENGRLEQCLTWLDCYLSQTELAPRIKTRTYGDIKEVYQIFRRRVQGSTEGGDHGWFLFQQLLPPEGRSSALHEIEVSGADKEIFCNNQGIMVIDDSGRPPSVAPLLNMQNPGAWVIALGIGVAHWQEWAAQFKSRFCLFCRLSDLETTRMEMDSSVTWETVVAMTIRALRTPEVGLWNAEQDVIIGCHVVVEMYPHGVLYIGPEGAFFRHSEGCLLEKSSPRHKGAVPCYDTLATSMLAKDCLASGGLFFCRNAFLDFSQRLLDNWQCLHERGYYFDRELRFPRLDFSASQNGETLSAPRAECTDPCFIELSPFSPDFDRKLEMVSGQAWNERKKRALRSFFPERSLYLERNRGRFPENHLSVIIDILHQLKEEVNCKRGFEELRSFRVGHLRITDPAELESVVTLQKVMDSYVSREQVQRPLCIGVFGPPGSGKSFAVKEVSRVIGRKFDVNPFEFFEFNLTQFEGPEEINSAIEPIRASVAKGKLPIVFWDEFDCPYDNHEFGYLRYFLPSMQDGVTYVRGTPYNIGRSIFVFAGGVKSSWEGMEDLLNQEDPAAARLVKTLKIPDFMSRLRVVLDIDGIDIQTEYLRGDASWEDLTELRRVLLKRAFIIAHQMDTHWKKAARKTSGLLLRLLLAEYKFGARSIEAVIEASGASDRLVYGLPELIAPSAARIHAIWRVELERDVDVIRKQQGLREVW